MLPDDTEFRMCWIGGVKHLCIKVGSQPERVLCWTRGMRPADLAALGIHAPVPDLLDVSAGATEAVSPATTVAAAA